jgi:N-methylhydantoinase A/oxoprolinase/acetone carboxylase beta subunit
VNSSWAETNSIYNMKTLKLSYTQTEDKTSMNTTVATNALLEGSTKYLLLRKDYLQVAGKYLMELSSL